MCNFRAISDFSYSHLIYTLHTHLYTFIIRLLNSRSSLKPLPSLSIYSQFVGWMLWPKEIDLISFFSSFFSSDWSVILGTLRLELGHSSSSFWGRDDLHLLCIFVLYMGCRILWVYWGLGFVWVSKEGFLYRVRFYFEINELYVWFYVYYGFLTDWKLLFEQGFIKLNFWIPSVC